jgi:methylmalonyl-CoA mutase
MNTLYKAIMDKVHEKTNSDLKSTFQITREMSEKFSLFRHTERVIYLKLLSNRNTTFQQLAKNKWRKIMEFSKR